jgi:hypothetical protein
VVLFAALETLEHNQKQKMHSILTETDSARIREVNALSEKLGLPSRLISIRKVLQRNVFADQQTDCVGEVHTVETNGVRTETQLWFRNGRVLRAS